MEDRVVVTLSDGNCIKGQAKISNSEIVVYNRSHIASFLIMLFITGKLSALLTKTFINDIEYSIVYRILPILIAVIIGWFVGWAVHTLYYHFFKGKELLRIQIVEIEKGELAYTDKKIKSYKILLQSGEKFTFAFSGKKDIIDYLDWLITQPTIDLEWKR